MTDFNLAALANLSDADLMMPLTFDDAAAPVTLAPAVTNVLHFGADQELPDLADLLAKADAVVATESVADLPARAPRIVGVPASENVSGHMRSNGAQLSDALRLAVRAGVGEPIKTPDDLRYALRVFAAHALNSLIGNRWDVLAERERTAAVSAHDTWKDRVLSALQGEVAAIKAAEHLTDAEFKFVLELVDSDRSGMAQNLAGPKVDVPALAAGRAQNWRALADAWAESCISSGNVTLDTGKDAAGWASYSLAVEPSAGWVLSVYVDQQWVPLEASAAGTERALADREQVMLQRSQAAKPAPYLGAVFPDKLRALL
ncbi:hypothetical protein [Pseudomonas savastanoi]|uniref:Uncharacterized protein n=2 Tax=Pseudomonas syringae group TaxID=136849 RepID=A0A0N8RLN6_PSESG|nr:hypothetical protein [Pseudomonas savastanoi]EFW81305.1 hypothetical protein PsgB076_07422 [Pseudomonas savastanoi pv. glycinea str. B076]KPC26219.1 Uncharacterized protein AC498_2206 [Pseudomonas savastanoi pv. glycinea]KPC30691.1 Uncharacterized protein AC497_1834 [Pseudomonas savastanoi pv. glycinea]KPC40421.1 Uncharacterized protein AC496_4980 [Pseudomonas savastanoi pv. glycinea]KPC41600.1 Uncharacterized protein ABK00_2341 [Pseudomonas savastanoi pv. glycinea]